MIYRPRRGKINVRFNGESIEYDINWPVAKILHDIIDKKMLLEDIHDERSYNELLDQMYLRYEGKKRLDEKLGMKLTYSGSLRAGDNFDMFCDGDTFELFLPKKIAIDDLQQLDVVGCVPQ